MPAIRKGSVSILSDAIPGMATFSLVNWMRYERKTGNFMPLCKGNDLYLVTSTERSKQQKVNTVGNYFSKKLMTRTIMAGGPFYFQDTIT